MNEERAPQDPRLFRTPEVTAHYWNNDFTADFSNVYQLANAGYKVIISSCSYGTCIMRCVLSLGKIGSDANRFCKLIY